LSTQRLYTIFGKYTSDLTDREVGQVWATSERAACDKADALLSPISVCIPKKGYLYITRAVLMEPLAVKYPGKIGDDF
jgi:hypothetical protein